METAMKKLKLSECAQIAEIVGAFAIILSLIFVGFQLNNNARATRSATATSTIASMSSWYAGMGQNNQTSANFINAMGNPDEQTREEWFQFVMNFHAFMLNAQNSYYLVNEGTLNLEIRDSLTAVIAAVKNQPGFHLYWEQRRDIFFPEFQAYVDEILASEQVNSKGLYRDITPAEDFE
jgi:hypothetical protein